MKKFLSVLLIIIMCGSLLGVNAEGGYISAELSSAGISGCVTEITLDLSVYNNSGIAYLKVDMEYPADSLRLKAVNDTGLIKGEFAVSEQDSVNPYSIQWVNAVNSYENGVAATVTFELIKAAKSGVNEITLTAEGYNQDYQRLSVDTVSGTVTVSQYEHSFEEISVLKEPTCTADGLSLKHCRFCDTEGTEVIPAEHTQGIWRWVDTAPENGAEALKEAYCYDCGGIIETKTGNMLENHGDLNQDGILNVIDLILIKKYLSVEFDYNYYCDLDGDSLNSAADMIICRSFLLRSIRNFPIYQKR